MVTTWRGRSHKGHNFEPRRRSSGRGGEWEMRSQRPLEQERHSQVHEGAGARGRPAAGLICIHRLVQSRWKVLSGGVRPATF